MRDSIGPRRGLTYADVLVTVAVLTLGGTVALGQIFRSRETSNRVKCASNLRQIGQGMLLYANDNKNRYPRVRATTPPKEVTLQYYTGVRADDPFEKGGPEANDVTAALFLMIRTVDLNGEVFRCPTREDARRDARRAAAKPGEPERAPEPWNVLKMSNFPGLEWLDYSLANPYPNEAAIKLGYKYNANAPADFALAADLNPGGEGLIKLTARSPKEDMEQHGNSLNHLRRQGQNVLFGDGHVDWSVNPFVGAKQDNIYAAADVRKADGGAPGQKDPPASVAGDQPQLDLDSVLLPRADQKATK